MTPIKSPRAAKKPVQPKAKPEAQPEKELSGPKLAIIRIRGTIRSDPGLRKTMELLKLFRQNYCIVCEKTPSMFGMATRVKDYSTFGDIDDDTYRMLCEKLPEGKRKGFFRLNPPRGGFERKGTKNHFNAGGALGDRKEKINDLIRRMVK